jgi:hypothetical protein
LCVSPRQTEEQVSSEAAILIKLLYSTEDKMLKDEFITSTVLRTFQSTYHAKVAPLHAMNVDGGIRATFHLSMRTRWKREVSLKLPSL